MTQADEKWAARCAIVGLLGVLLAVCVMALATFEIVAQNGIALALVVLAAAEIILGVPLVINFFVCLARDDD